MAKINFSRISVKANAYGPGLERIGEIRERLKTARLDDKSK